MPTPQCITMSLEEVEVSDVSRSIPRARIPPAVPLQPACSSATARPGTTRYTGIQSATVTEKYSRSGGHPPIDPAAVEPPLRGIQSHQFDAVHLISQSDRRELTHLSAEREPSAHDLAYGLLGPEAQIKSPTRLTAPSSNACDHREAFSPIGDFVPGDGAGNRLLG